MPASCSEVYWAAATHSPSSGLRSCSWLDGSPKAHLARAPPLLDPVHLQRVAGERDEAALARVRLPNDEPDRRAAH